MNVDIVGKLQASHCKDGDFSTFCVRQPNRVALNSNGPHIVFQKLYAESASDADLFYGSISPLIDLCVAGFNVCLLIMGTKNSQKSFLIGGSRSSTGIVAYLFRSLFNRLNKGNVSKLESMVKPGQEPNVTIQMWEVSYETIRDLLAATQNKTNDSYRQLVETPISGAHVENCATLNIQNTTDAMTKFHLGWSMRDINQSVWNDTSAFIQIQIHLNGGISSLQTDTKFTIVELPCLENLIDCQEFDSENFNVTQDKSLKILKDVVTTLAHRPNFSHNANYQSSKLSLMLKEELGGNYRTCAVLSLDATIKADLFKEIQIFTQNLSQVVNFPVVNDVWIQELLTQHRAQIIDLKRQLDFFLGQRNPSVAIVGSNHFSQRKLQQKNVQLQNTKDDLLAQIDKLQRRYEALQLSETDLSCQLLMNEEERLKLSESVIDYQIQLKELEKSAINKEGELTEKIIELEKILHDAEGEKALLLQQRDTMKGKLSTLEEDKNLLMEDHSKLKTTHRNLNQRYEIEIKKNEELNVEVVNLVNHKSALEKELHEENHHLNQKDHTENVSNNVSELNQIIADLKEKLAFEKQVYKADMKALKIKYAAQLKKEWQKQQIDEARTLKTTSQRKKADNSFSHRFNRQLEDERAQLLSENQVLQTEVRELRQYINQFFGRQWTAMKKKENRHKIVSQRRNIFPAIHSSLN